jgi:hypothetical protein
VRLWRAANQGALAQMRVKAREHVEELLDRVVEESRAVAA